MTSILAIKRRVGGAQTAPTGTNHEGEMAAYFPGVAGDTTTPTLYINDGGGWRVANPPAAAPTVGTVALPGGTAGSKTGLGAAWTAFTPKPADPIIIASFAGSAYVKTGSGGVDADWTGLGSSTSFATAGDIHTGTDTAKALNSAVLRGETLNTPSAGTASAADADKLLRLDANGQLDDKFLKAVPTKVRGGLDVTAAMVAPTPAYTSGDIVFANADGNIDASWTGTSGQAVKSGDALLFDGTNWHHIPNSTDLNAYLALAGGTMADGAVITFDTTTGGAGTVILDGKNGKLKDVQVDAGNY